MRLLFGHGHRWMLVLVLVLALAPWVAAPLHAQTGEIPGERVQVATPIQQTTASLNAAERTLAALPAPKPLLRAPRKSSQPTQVSTAPLVVGQLSGEPGLLAAQTASTPNFTGATLADTSAFPPDSMGAVGPTQFIVAINGRIRSFNKSSGVADGVLNTNIAAFFNSVRGANGVSDPRIRYDRASGRWFVIIINVAVPNKILLAVSDTSTITAGTVWSFSAITNPATNGIGQGCLLDYPTLGIDALALYIGGTNFCGASLNTAAFFNSDAFVIQKASALAGGALVVTHFPNLINGGTGPATPQGVDNFDLAPSFGYIVGADLSSRSLIDLRRISNPGGVSPTISANIAITISATQSPITVDHLGNNSIPQSIGQLDPVDDRLMMAVIRNNRLWTTHAIGVDVSGQASASADRNGVRWYEIQDIASTPTVRQSGTVFDSTANARSYWIPSLNISGQGHVAMGFSAAGPNDRINAATVGRLAGDALGTVQGPPTLYTNTNGSYNPAGEDNASNGFRRWGDFSFTSVDPDDDMTMWTIQEFCDANNSYGVRVVRLLAPPPGTPTVNTTPIAAGSTNLDVVLVGTNGGGAGFFDPGAGFTRRLTASIGGTGVTLNSVTFLTSTTLRLNITVAPGAVVGYRNVTVTNPDGQSATAPALYIGQLNRIALPLIVK